MQSLTRGIQKPVGETLELLVSSGTKLRAVLRGKAYDILEVRFFASAKTDPSARDPVVSEVVGSQGIAFCASIRM